MNRAPYLFIAAWVAGVMFLSSCSGASQSPATATAARQAPASVQAATATPQTQTRTTNRQPTAAATVTATATSQKATAMIVTPTQPVASPTTGIRAVGSLPIPDKRQPVVFAANAVSAVITVDLPETQPVAYQFAATAGQIIHLAVAGSTNLQVFNPSLAPISQNVKMPGSLSLVLTDAGNYVVVLQGRANPITLSLYLPPANGNLAGAAPLAEKPQAVTIPALPYTVNFPSRLDPALPQDYTFPAQAGQLLSLAVSGNLTATVIAPDGNSLLADTDSIETPWIFALPETGTYHLVLLGSGVVNVTARLTPAPAGTPLAAPKAGSAVPLMILPGQSKIALRTYFTSNKPQTYVLRLPAKEILFVNTTGTAQVTQITGPDQKPLPLNHAEYTQRWSANAATAGEYTVTLSGSGLSILTFSVPIPIPAP